MNHNLGLGRGVLSTRDDTFNQLGTATILHEDGMDRVAVDLQFRMATNAVLCNTLVNGEPIISTSAGSFHE